MICEKIIGKLDSQKVSGKKVEYVDIDWDDAFKKIHKKTTDAGTELADRVIAVRIPPCEVIRVRVAPDHGFMTAKVCYEIGNRHAPLFYGKDAYSFITPYNEPMLQMLSKLHGVTAERAREKLDFDRRISSGAPGHHHH